MRTLLSLTDAKTLAALCADAQVTFIVNDDPEFALAAGANGVHLGRQDPSYRSARFRLGPSALIGASCYNLLERAREAIRSGCDYVAFGSFYPSPHKPEAVRASLGLLRDARRELRDAGVTNLPIVAIGGISVENTGELIAAGADLVAVISGVFDCADPEAAARRYTTAINNAIANH